MSPESKETEIPFALVEDILMSQEYIDAVNKTQHLRVALNVSMEKIEAVAKQTIGQRSNALWCAIR